MNENIQLPLQNFERRFREAAHTLPRIAGNEAVNFALDNFKRQGFLGNSFQPWRPRKRGGGWGKKAERGNRSILVKTARLKRSIRIKRATWEEVVVGSDVPYAQAHNEGVRLGEIQQVKQHERKITAIRVIRGIERKKSSSIKIKRVHTGGYQTVKAHQRRVNQNIPARPFLKDSPYLQRNIQRAIAAVIIKAYNNIS